MKMHTMFNCQSESYTVVGAGYNRPIVNSDIFFLLLLGLFSFHNCHLVIIDSHLGNLFTTKLH